MTLREGFGYFKEGYLEGLDTVQELTKTPRWGAWVIAIATLPLNLCILIIILVWSGIKGVCDFAESIRRLRA